MTKKKLFIFSLLSISFFLTSYGAIAAGIPLMQAAFPNQALSSIELLSTIPSFAVTIFVLVSDPLSKKIGEKETVILGLVVAIISGIVPYFSNSFLIILISRFTLGVGLGLYNSLAVSLISDFFEGELRAKLIGFQTAIQGLGTAFLTYIAGKLMMYGWRNMFLIYGIGIPCVLLFLFFVPNPKKNKDVKAINDKPVSDEPKKGKVKINSSVIQYAVLLFFIMGLFMVLSLKMGTILIEEKYGDVENAATILTLYSAAATVAGFCFGYVFKKLKDYTIMSALLMICLTFIGIYISRGLILTSVLVVVCGFASSMLVPAIFTKISVIAPKDSVTFATSLMIVGSNLGVFVSPYILALLEQIFKAQESQITLFLIIGIIFGVMGVFSLIRNKSIEGKWKESK